MNAYARDKLAHFPDRIIELRQGRQPAPIQVLVSPCDLCNHDCPWCSFRNSSLPTAELFAGAAGERNPDRKLPTAKALEIIADCRAMGVRAIQLTGGGEPTLHPDFSLICDAILEAGLALGLITNGCYLDDRRIEALRRATWVRISVDAGWQQTHARLHRVSGAHWAKLWRAVGELRALEGPTVGTSFIVQAANWAEAAEFCHLSRRHGAHHARLSPLIDAQGEDYFAPFRDQAINLCRMAAKAAGDGFEVYNQFDGRLEHMKPPDFRTCYHQQLAPFIGADQNVYRCCNTAYTWPGLLGNIRPVSFRQLWESEAKRRMMDEFDATGCQFCNFKDKNRTAAALVAEPEGHDCFA